MKRKILISILTLVLISCETDSPMIIDLTNLELNDGFLDVPLSVVEQTEFDTHIEYHARATNESDTLGLLVKLKKDIPAGFVDGEPKNMFVKNGIEFISTGAESNRLLGFLAGKYGLNDSDLALMDSQVFICANLNDNKPNYRTGGSRFKIFLEGDEDYAELFVNFDFSQRIIHLNEKDPEYREPLIKLLKK